MLLDRKREWTVAADSSDQLDLLHVMEALLLDVAPPVVTPVLKDYFIGAGGSDNHHHVTADDLLDVAAAMSKPATTVKAAYVGRSAEGDRYSFDVWVARTGDAARPFKVTVWCYGPMNDNAAKFFDGIHARFTKEIGRRNRAAPTPPPPTRPQQPINPAARKASAASVARDTGSAANPAASGSFFTTLTTHPLPVTVIGSIIAGGVIWLLGLLVTNHRADELPATPPPTTTQMSPASTTTGTPTSSAAVSSTLTPSGGQ